MVSRGRQKQSIRGPVKRNNPSFTPLDMTPTSRLSREDDDTKLALETPTGANHGEVVEQVNCSQDDMFNEDALDDSDLLALENQSSLQGPDRKKSFAWSEGDSVSRRSSPVLAGETPQAEWQLDGVDSIPNPYSSPCSGTGNFPSTMPLQKDHLDALLPSTSTGNSREACFDFSETASTARRSTPFDSFATFDDVWELGDSNTVTPHGSCMPQDLSPVLSSGGKKSSSLYRNPQGVPENPQKLTPAQRLNLFSKEETRVPSKGRTVNRRKQRAKPPIQVVDSIQPLITNTSRAGEINHQTRRKLPIEALKRNKMEQNSEQDKTHRKIVKPAAIKRRSQPPKKGIRCEGDTAVPSSKKLQPKDVDSTWKPSPASRHAADTSMPSLQKQQPIMTIGGPAANTRGRGKKMQDLPLPEKAQIEKPKQTSQQDSPMSDLPSSQSIQGTTSDESDLSSPAGLDSTYFLQSREAEAVNSQTKCPAPTEEENNLGQVQEADSAKCLATSVDEAGGGNAALGAVCAAHENEVQLSDFLKPAASETCHARQSLSEGDDQDRSMFHAVVASEQLLTELPSTSGCQNVPLQVCQSHLTIELSSDSESSTSDNEGVPIRKQDRGCSSEPQDKIRLHRVNPCHDQSEVPSSHIQKPSISSVTTALPRPPAARGGGFPTSTETAKPIARPANTSLIHQRKEHCTPLTVKDVNLVHVDHDQGIQGDKRIVSVSEEGSPLIASITQRKRKRDDADLMDSSPLDDKPIELIYASRSLAGSDAVGSVNCQSRSQPLRSGHRLATSRKPDTSLRNIDHLSGEANNLIKNVVNRLQGLATDLRDTDIVYKAKMARCLSKIQQREREEARNLETVNRDSLKRFRVLVEEVRNLIEEEASDRQKRINELDRLRASRGKAYEVALSGMEKLLQSLGSGQ